MHIDRAVLRRHVRGRCVLQHGGDLVRRVQRVQRAGVAGRLHTYERRQLQRQQRCACRRTPARREAASAAPCDLRRRPTSATHAGTCDPTTGTCSNLAVADGTACAGNDICLQKYACQGGKLRRAAAPWAARRLTSAMRPVRATNDGRRAPTRAVADGTSCSTHNACTIGDTCQGGTCTAGTRGQLRRRQPVHGRHVRRDGGVRARAGQRGRGVSSGDGRVRRGGDVHGRERGMSAQRILAEHHDVPLRGGRLRRTRDVHGKQRGVSA